MYSERELGILPRWFSGAEWADGSAELVSKHEYREAVKRVKKVPQLAPKTPKQAVLFDSSKTMSLTDCMRESGRLRRVMYGKMMAEENKKQPVTIQPVPKP